MDVSIGRLTRLIVQVIGCLNDRFHPDTARNTTEVYSTDNNDSDQKNTFKISSDHASFLFRS
jgi:hypothetical protein